MPFIRRKLAVSVSSIAVLLMPPAYAADPPPTPCCRENNNPRWYAGISGSVVFLRDTQISHSSAAYPNPDRQTYKPGFGISGQVGYKVYKGVRAELEVIQRTNDVDKDSTGALVPSGNFAEQKSIGIMLNGYIDFINNTNFTPYIGAGLGRMYVKNPRFYTDGGTLETSKKLKGWTTAYQFMLGMNYPVEGTPFEMTGGYRYFSGLDVDTKSTLSNFPSDISFPNDSHNLEMGVRMYF